jgi:predicted amidohydrolase YtcJ
MGRAVIPGLIDNHMHLCARRPRGCGNSVSMGGVAKAGDQDAARPGESGGAGEWVYNIGGWAINSSRTIQNPLRAKNWIRLRRIIRCRSRNRTIKSF